MNIALLIAGGAGTRMKQDIPKQFLTVNEKTCYCIYIRGISETC